MSILTGPLPANVLDALQRGKLIEAIMLLRGSTGLGLKEAKDVIDQHLRAIPVSAPHNSDVRCMNDYQAEKLLWSEKDFDQMSWHDCRIHAIRLSRDLCLDIDYILKWVLDERTSYYKFWVAAATVTFRNAHHLIVNIELAHPLGLEIANLHQVSKAKGEYEYRIETQEGDIQFTATGFEQFIRTKPIFTESQSLDEEERGKPSFSEAAH